MPNDGRSRSGDRSRAAASVGGRDTPVKSDTRKKKKQKSQKEDAPQGEPMEEDLSSSGSELGEDVDKMAEFETKMQEMVNGMQKMVTEAVGDLGKQTACNTADIRELKKGQKQHDKEFELLQKRMSEFETHMGKIDGQYNEARSVAETLSIIDEENWTRKPDPTIFRANTSDDLSLDDFKKGLVSWFEDSNVLPENVNVEGPPLGKRWTIRFNHSDESTRVRLALQAAGALRAGGKWRVFEAKGQRIYLERDKNPKRIREEMFGRRVLKALPAGSDAYVNRREENHIEVMLNKETLVQITVPSREADVQMEWDNALAKKVGIKAAEVQKQATEFTKKESGKMFGKAEGL